MMNTGAPIAGAAGSRHLRRDRTFSGIFRHVRFPSYQPRRSAKSLIDVQCYEICPFCHEIITQVYRFANHDCKAPRDKAKNTYLQRRVKHLNEVVTRELNRLNKLRDKTRKRKRGDPDSDSVPPQKLVKMKHHVEGSGEASREMACPLDPMKIAAANNSEWPSDSAELITEVISGGALDNGPPAFAGAGVVVNSEWVLTETAATVPSDSALGNEAPAVNNRGWEFAETDAIVYADNAGIPPDVLSDPGLAEAVISSNDGGWAFAEMTTFPPADDSGWAFTNTVGAMCTNDAGWAFERDP